MTAIIPLDLSFCDRINREWPNYKPDHFYSLESRRLLNLSIFNVGCERDPFMVLSQCPNMHKISTDCINLKRNTDDSRSSGRRLFNSFSTGIGPSFWWISIGLIKSFDD